MISSTVTVNYYCHPEMFDTASNPKDRVVHNLFDRFLLQAFRFAGYLCSSPRWKSSPNLGVDICVFIYRLSNRMNNLIDKWKRNSDLKLQCCLTLADIHYIAIASFHLLWSKGPHKVTCRIKEREIIQNCFQHFNNDNYFELFNLPKNMYKPFDSIEL